MAQLAPGHSAFGDPGQGLWTVRGRVSKARPHAWGKEACPLAGVLHPGDRGWGVRWDTSAPSGEEAAQHRAHGQRDHLKRRVKKAWEKYIKMMALGGWDCVIFPFSSLCVFPSSQNAYFIYDRKNRPLCILV